MTVAARRRTALLSALVVAGALLTAFTVPADADPGPTTVVGLTDDDAPPVNGSGTPVISGDGSTVLFRSFGDDIEGDAPGSELFARDRADSTTEAVDLPPAGETFPANRGVTYYDVSADGRYVVFDLLTPESCDNAELRECFDVYWRDRQTGTTELVSVAPDGMTAGDLDSYDPSISADGQRVVFHSQATNLVATTLAAYENVFVRDMSTGTTELVNQTTEGDPGNDYAGAAAISGDGETVVFQSAATNFFIGSSGNDLFLRHLDTDTTEAVLPFGNYPFTQSDPALNGDGSVVAFFTRSDLLGTGASTSITRVYTIDLADDSIRTAPEHSFGTETDPDLSTDGRHVAYRTQNPIGEDVPGIYVWDRDEDTTEVESVRSDGTPYTTQPFRKFMSGDGRFVVFQTLQPAYAGDVDDTTLDSVIHDRAEPTDTASGPGAASTASPGGPTYDDTLHASVAGSPGTVTVTELETEDPDAGPIDGYQVLGQQVRVTADPVVPPAFLTFTFEVDASVLPAGGSPTDVDVFRNGAALAACSGPADPGPCVASRTELASGDWQFVAHSPQASVWAVALDLTPTPPPPSDDVPPTIQLTRPADGATYRLGQSVTASYQCSDADSGIASCQGTRPHGSRLATGSIGTKSFTVTATDEAGNTATRTVTYRVVWPLTGLHQPVDNPPVLNLEKAGAVIPVRFTLGGYRGTQVFAAGYPRSTAVPCQARPRTDEIEQTLSGSASGLSYRNGVYTYAWRTQKAWASRYVCRRLEVRFKDGQERTALFRLR